MQVASCIPQGDVQHATAPNLPCQLEATSVDDTGLGSFFQALYQLRRRVEVSFGANLPPRAARELSEALSDIETVHSNCAPVMKLLNHRLISRRTEPQLSQASQRDTDPGGSSPRQTQSQVESPRSTKHHLTLSEMCAALPSDSDIAEILTTRNQWWVTWRQSFGLAWGELEGSTLTQFATRAICAEKPSLLGLCLISALQPRRAWLVYRKANALLQLMGIHRSRRRSESLDLIFWQLSADRWSPVGYCFSTVVGVDQEIDKITAQLPWTI
ncbi:hypothetical protein PENFLA_c009G08600 [Penicillium flavigenum]|uniref:Uncharacterized protein n=1 Tax=Penicillium flavigenum TaxID=254877 RepID=A0A1V6TGC3_9EURO|nr:hypothetical protein PENFLA_c009G08600 [Penicillium flavigenum]